jgi:hypothetical protein
MTPNPAPIKDSEILARVNKSLDLLLVSDEWLLTQDLSEQSITHKLAEHIQRAFEDHHVDCEYNGNNDDQRGIKKIFLLKNELEAKGLLRETEQKDIDKDMAERRVFPDIIIHRRKTNDFNICVIEVKKSTSNVPFDYDSLKLQAYTRKDYHEDLNYQLGLFILLYTKVNPPSFEIEHFKNGALIAK